MPGRGPAQYTGRPIAATSAWSPRAEMSVLDEPCERVPEGRTSHHTAMPATIAVATTATTRPRWPCGRTAFMDEPPWEKEANKAPGQCSRRAAPSGAARTLAAGHA